MLLAAILFLNVLFTALSALKIAEPKNKSQHVAGAAWQAGYQGRGASHAGGSGVKIKSCDTLWLIMLCVYPHTHSLLLLFQKVDRRQDNSPAKKRLKKKAEPNQRGQSSALGKGDGDGDGDGDLNANLLSCSQQK